MHISQNSRRNFLSSIAILSAGTAFIPAIKKLSFTTEEQKDLQKKWKSFWKKSGGQKFTSIDEPQRDNNHYFSTKGHFYRNGEMIYFPHESILAQPMWIFWKNNLSEPADVVITLYDSDSLKKIARLNRFEINALYKLSAQFHDDNLLGAHCNNLKPNVSNNDCVIKNRIIITKNSQIQQLSYYKEQALVLNKKFIHNT